MTNLKKAVSKKETAFFIHIFLVLPVNETNNKLTMTKFLWFLPLIVFLISCKSVEPPKPVLPVPSERQLAWHELEFYAFVHFNMNTFTNMEWGLGDEDPALFNPTELDCRQWARVVKEAGMKGIILTAKHHDGFCLWPSAYTEHSVKNSPWKNGKGDVVSELANACKEYGLKLGIYLSPWDRNHPDYGKPEYITYFRNQLRELLTNYGDVFEVWFDGANGGTGYYGGANEERRVDKLTYYDWENTYKIVRKLQPQAVIFSDAGPDVRWVGNERGFAYPTTWSNLMRDEIYGGMPDYSKKYSHGQENGSHWVPAEVDVSIRPGWYFHPSENHKVKSLPQLLEIYYNSIGRNASLLINFPVDTRGLIYEKDAEQILKLAATVKKDFEVNLAEAKKVIATNTRGNSNKYKAANLTDDDDQTYWATDDNTITASVTIDFEKPTEFNRLLLQEYIRLGQRVKKFSVDAFVNDEWKEIENQTTIGRKRILRFPNVTATKLRLNILDSKACPVLSNIGVYKASKVLVAPKITRNKKGEVNIQSFDTGLDIYYSKDGTEPDLTSTKYTKPFILRSKSTIKAIVYDKSDKKQSNVSTEYFDVAKTKWKMAGEFKGIDRAEFIFDGNENTAWVLRNKPPVSFIIDLGEKVNVAGFRYLPDQGRRNEGIILNYEFYVSNDAKNWPKPLAKGEFANIKNSPVWQQINVPVTTGRFIMLKAITSADDNGMVGIAEFDIITE